MSDGIRALRSFAVGVLAALAGAAVVWANGDWLPLRADGIHDPENPAIDILLEPAAALSELPPDDVGNRVRWVTALEGGYIEPRARFSPDARHEILDLDIVMKNTGSAAWVLFPHRLHTEWLDCDNCHNELFLDEAGATPVTMLEILMGEYCGRCHGAVAFPLLACNRCHSVPVDE